MENIQATFPSQLVYLDYLTIELMKGGKDVHMLVITDNFTQYAWALVTSLQTAKYTTQALWDQCIVHYGLPESIVFDQGWNFKNYLITELCKLAKVQKLHTSHYHLQTSRQCECLNHTVINMLGTLPPNKKSSCRNMAPTLVHVYNYSRSRAMGFSSYYLMHCKNPWLPVDLYFGTQRADMNATTSTKFMQQLLQRLKWAYKTTQNII